MFDRYLGYLYIVYPDGIGRSRLTGTLIETKLGTRGTGRNWNTVVKLEALADQFSEEGRQIVAAKVDRKPASRPERRARR